MTLWRWDRQPTWPQPSAVGGRAAAGIATQTFGGGKGRIDLDAIPDLSTTRGGTQVRLRATPPFAGLRASSFLAPFGAALGNPEITGRQTVRAMAKNASSPNGNLAGRGICPGVSGWTRVYLQNFRYTVFQEVVREKSGCRIELQRPPVIKLTDYSGWCSGFRGVNRNLSAKEDSL